MGSSPFLPAIKYYRKASFQVGIKVIVGVRKDPSRGNFQWGPLHPYREARRRDPEYAISLSSIFRRSCYLCLDLTDVVAGDVSLKLLGAYGLIGNISLELLRAEGLIGKFLSNI